ncbi:MAG: O-antigen ligase family protein [Rhizobiaceae bacterium]
MSLELTPAISTAPAVPRITAGRLSRWTVALCAFLGAFVIREPAPYEVVLAAVMVAFLLFGMRLSSLSVTLATLFALFNMGSLLSMFTMSDLKEVPLYLAVSFFLGLTAVFWCATIEADMARIRSVMRGYVAGAAITSLLGIAGYFNAFPGSVSFTTYGRASGAFQDPNVFGPFLIFPTLYLVYGLIYRSPSLAPVRAALLLVLLAGIFLSFSRGAWGGLALSGITLYALLIATEQSSQKRARLLLIAGVGVLALALLLAVALQFDAVYSMFEQRARVVQEYDGARLGRFARHAIGFQWALEKPLGIGPLEFGYALGEDTHNIWLKSLMAYGWLGFASYLVMTIITLVGGARLLGRKRAWQPYLICAWSVFVAHLVVAWVIDIDHWRHVYLIIGMIWGCMALEVRQKHPHNVVPGV